MTKCCCVLAAAVVLTATAAIAQTTAPPDDARSIGQLRFGTFLVTPTVHLVEFGYDTNVFDLSGTERQPADFTTTLQPRLEAVRKGSRLTVDVTGLADFIYYAKYASERSINPRIDVLVDDKLSSHVSLYGELHVGFSRSRSGLEVDERARQLSGSGLAGMRLRRAKLEFDMRGSYTPTYYADSARYMDVRLADTLDRTTAGVSGTALFHASPYTAFTAGIEETATRFRYSSVRDIDSTRISGGVQFNPRAMIAGTADFGYSIARPLDPLTPAFSGFTPHVGLSWRLRDTTGFSFAADRDMEPSYDLNRPYYIYLTYEGSVRQAIAHKFDVGTAVQYSLVSYRWFVTADSNPIAGIPDRVRSIMGTLGLPVVKRVRVEVYVAEWQRLSGPNPYTTLRTGIQMTVGKASLTPRGVFVSGLGR